MPVELVASASTSQAIAQAVERAAHFLLGLQTPQGYWVGELEADTTVESDSIKFWHWLGRVDRKKEQALVRTILKNQLPDGGWPIYRGGPAELNASVKGYVALRLAGLGSDQPFMKRARQVILKLGGLERINSFEKVYLALFGCYPWDQVPALPPELILLPKGFYFNIYEVAYWSRTILVPLAVVYATRPMAKENRLALDELWVSPASRRAQITNLQKGGFFWRGFFLLANRILKWHETWGVKPLRRRALKKADQWITERLIQTDGLGAIFPAMLNAAFALKGLGYSEGDPLFEQAVRDLERLEIWDGEDLKVQPCFSPVWDTGLALYALCKAGVEAPESVRRAEDWLLAQEIRRWGDWAVKNRSGRPGGWAFEFRNPVYPDVDDTAQVLLAFLSHAAPPSEAAGAFKRGLDWILSMQNADGGWSSFDKDNNKTALTHFPFADHNAMLDPSAADITGRILELLAKARISRSEPAVKRAIQFLEKAQESDGTWFGRWGVNYLYGTWLALRGLQAIGEPLESARYQRAGRWLIQHQNSDGGWGESCRSYEEPSAKGKGPSTPSQTAWALMALIHLGMVAQPAFTQGLHYLLQTQKEDGSWAEEPFTGTGFPRVFYLKYHLYPVYFPLLALSQARSLFKESR